MSDVTCTRYQLLPKVRGKERTMITAKRIIFLHFLIALTACATFDPARLSKEQQTATTEIARTKALRVVAASPEENKIIKEQQPKWGYYVLSGPQAQYWFLWELGNDKVVEVSGIGDIRTLEGAKVIRRSK